MWPWHRQQWHWKCKISRSLSLMIWVFLLTLPFQWWGMIKNANALFMFIQNNSVREHPISLMEMAVAIVRDIACASNFENKRHNSHTMLAQYSRIKYSFAAICWYVCRSATRVYANGIQSPARWATGFSGDLRHDYLLSYIMYWFL